ncbi:limbic system-associated membrane protein-like [Gigantopelta aegis]|uniref:limbic system-associated membrane protein-like n=1 Tax=Gigantopelta aegis TaxID=1735272 RepID=UPI001B88C496|nr:limbic system-associated membrane protein-like [Gigantopelta aegis]
MLTYIIYLLAAACHGAVLGEEPRFNVFTKNVTVVVGQTAVLPCSVDKLGDYKNKKGWVVWLDHRDKLLTFEDRRIIADERISLERTYVKEWNLHIRNVKAADEGIFTCQINTDPVQIRPIWLHIHEPAKINRMLSSSDVTAKEGDTVTLVCNVTGVPPPTVSWYRIIENERDKGERGKEKIGIEGEVLLIHNVTRYCDDTYECVAFNGVPPADSKRMRVNVEFPPEIRLPNRKIGQSLGKETILECVIQAYPIGVTVWKKDGKILDQTWKYRTEVYVDDGITITLSLRVQSIDSDDFGEYICEAENLLGKDFETMVLYEYIEYKPPPTTTTPKTRITTLYDYGPSYLPGTNGDFGDKPGTGIIERPDVGSESGSSEQILDKNSSRPVSRTHYWLMMITNMIVLCVDWSLSAAVR